MDRDDARDMFDDLYGDYEGDWDDLTIEPDNYYEGDCDEEYSFEFEPKNKFKLFVKEENNIRYRFKKFIVKEVNNKNDIFDLLVMVKDQMFNYDQLFDYGNEESKKIMSHIEIESKALFLLEDDSFNKEELEKEGYEILSEEAVDKIVETRKMLIKTLSEKFIPVYQEEFYNRIMNGEYSYYWKISQLCKTIDNLEETCKEFYMDDSNKLMD